MKTYIPLFPQVRNVFGSEGYVPLTALRVDEESGRRLGRSVSKVNIMKSAENLADKRRQSSRLDLLRSAGDFCVDCVLFVLTV